MRSWVENKPRIRNIFIIIVTTLGVYLVFQYILPLILPFLFAYFLAWMIRPSTEFLYRKMKLPRIIGGTLSITVLLAVLGTGLYYLFNTLLKQIINLIRNIPIYANAVADKLDHLCAGCDKTFGLEKGTLRGIMDDNLERMLEKLKTNVMPGITQRTIALTLWVIALIGLCLITIISAVLIAKDLPDFRQKYADSDFYKDLHRITDRLSEAGIAYLRSQLIIMVIIAFISVLGLTILKNEYALLAGIIIALMDALPILGSGLIYIPWSIIMLINGNIYAAAILITTFLICQIIREILEPKLIGSCIGIKPLFTIISMYVGVKLFSIAGFILGPVGLTIIVTIVKALNEKKEADSFTPEI
jgi:sporulation integral membrane protein YtvI